MCARAAATDPKEADIIWTSTQVDEDMKKATGITDRQYVNQFPFEACLVMKHHLAETVHKVKKQNTALNSSTLLALGYFKSSCSSNMLSCILLILG